MAEDLLSIRNQRPNVVCVAFWSMDDMFGPTSYLSNNGIFPDGFFADMHCLARAAAQWPRFILAIPGSGDLWFHPGSWAAQLYDTAAELTRRFLLDIGVICIRDSSWWRAANPGG